MLPYRIATFEPLPQAFPPSYRLCVGFASLRGQHYVWFGLTITITTTTAGFDAESSLGARSRHRKLIHPGDRIRSRLRQVLSVVLRA